MIKWIICALSLTGVIYDLVFLRRAYPISIMCCEIVIIARPQPHLSSVFNREYAITVQFDFVEPIGSFRQLFHPQ